MLSEPPKDPKDRVKEFPHAPGVYLMKDRVGRVLYIGKAVDLRNRASSYFTRQAAEDYINGGREATPARPFPATEANL